MRCERVRLQLSVALDESLTDDETAALRAHVAGCPGCAAQERVWRDVRRQLRVEVVGEMPDVAPRVLHAISTTTDTPRRPHRPRRSRRRMAWRLVPVPLVATFVAGALIGAGIVAVNRPAEVVAADLGARVLEAQRTLETLAADVRIVERGWHPDVATRTFRGTLRYRAPESVGLRMTDETRYPSSRWRANDTDLVITEGRWWSHGPGACPVQLQPGCSLNQPRLRALTRREPFAEDSPAPLDVVLPARSFSVPTGTTRLQTGTVAGRSAIGLRTTVAEVTPILSGLRSVGNWRELYPGDDVEVWLDKDHLVPLELVVRPTTDAVRRRWAAERGYRDPPGRVLLKVSLSGVSVNRRLPPNSFPSAPNDAPTRDAGFVARSVPATIVPVPSHVPAGMRAYRSGIVTPPGATAVGVRTWTDGRSWVKVRATRASTDGALFDDLGDVVRPVQLGEAGVAYLGERGDRVALHGQGIDVVVEGSVDETDLRAVAASLGVHGLPVSGAWAAAGTGTVTDATAVLPGLLVVSGLDGFRAPGLRIDDRVVTLDYAGAGARGFRLTEAPGDTLVPPLDPDVRGVEVRDTVGRYQPSTGELEWVEAGMVISLRSTTLALDELLGVSDHLRGP
ncbi:MAG: zf-HC2 domain-containing protein [Actinobacteria bacterium]|nr:MAG: zf-HC2 domain-containing protein [Actinomycetota bacterium]